MTTEWKTPEQVKLDKLVAWDNAKKQLEQWKATEMELRKECSAAYFPTPEKGTQRVELAADHQLKLVHKVNYKLDKDNDKIDAVQDGIDKLGNEGPFLSERLFKWTVELSVSEYGKLDMNNPTHKAAKALVDSVLTTEAGAPTLEIEPPKTKKA